MYPHPMDYQIVAAGPGSWTDSLQHFQDRIAVIAKHAIDAAFTFSVVDLFRVQLGGQGLEVVDPPVEADGELGASSSPESVSDLRAQPE